MKMMAQVILLQPKPNAALHGKVVDRVMDRVVTSVAEDEAGKHCWRNPPKSCEEDRKENDRERNADDRRHDQPLGVVGIIMLNTVHDEVQLFA